MQNTHSSATWLDPFDIVIVGGGLAGCLLANRLSAFRECRVLLLEAGGRDDWPWIHIPAGYLFAIGNPRTDWCYQTVAEPGLNGRAILYARGKTLGGSSSINAMISMRGQARDYDEWAALTGDARWSWQSVLPVFRQTEDHHAGTSAFHSAGGEWRVEPQRLDWDILDHWQAAAAECGIAPVPDFNIGNNAGSARFEVNQRMGVRWNAAKAFLRAAESRPNLAVITSALVHRLLFDHSSGSGPPRAVGVVFSTREGLFHVRARREVVLAAGAVNSPQLLMRSGIGPAEHLNAHNIPVVHDAGGVGQNLQDHLQLRLAFRVRGVRTLNEWFHRWSGKLHIGLSYALQRRGPLTMAPSQLGAFAYSSSAHATPNLQYHVQPLTLDRFGEPLHREPGITMSVCNLRPTSRGTIALQSADPSAPPVIAPHYLSTKEDQQVAVEAIRLTRQIAAAPALARWQPTEFRPGPNARTDEELLRAAGDIGTTIFHPVGTCRMGATHETSAVVDSELRVRGVAGLSVVDASIMPTITSGNTATPTVMIAERGAALIAARLHLQH